MFLQTKMAITVATRYVFWDAGMTKMLTQSVLCPDPAGGAYSAPQTPWLLLSLYLNIAGL